MQNALLRWACAPLAPPVLQFSRIEGLILAVFFAAVIGTILQFFVGLPKVVWGAIAAVILLYLELLFFPLRAGSEEAANDNRPDF